jgi:hypothetical protein
MEISLDVAFVSSSPLFPKRTTVHASERVKFLAHAGSRRFREDETDQSFGEIMSSFSLYSSNYTGLDFDKRRRKGYRKDLSESRKMFRPPVGCWF